MCPNEHTPGSPASPGPGENQQSYSQLPVKPLLERNKRSVTYPGEVEPDIQARLKELGITFQEWLESLMAYDIMVSGKHRMTGDYRERHGSVKGRWEMWRDAVEMRREGIPHAQIFDVLLERYARNKGST